MSLQVIKGECAQDSGDEQEQSATADLIALVKPYSQFVSRWQDRLEQLRRSNTIPTEFFAVVKQVLGIESARTELLSLISARCEPAPEQLEVACDLLLRAALAQCWLRQQRHSAT